VVLALDKKTFHHLTSRKSIHLSVIENVVNFDNTAIIKVEAIDYKHPRFRYWARNEEISIPLQDWSAENICTMGEDMENVSNIGVHVRSGNKGDWQNQAWVKRTVKYDNLI